MGIPERDKGDEVQRELMRRALPDLMELNGRQIRTAEDWEEKRRNMKKVICRELYGFMPFRECCVRGDVVRVEKDAYGGKACRDTVLLQISTSVGNSAFFFELSVPKGIDKPPVFLDIAGPSASCVTEELIDNGYAAAHVFYQDIMPDRPEAESEGVGRLIEKIPYIGWGKIAMWAYGISRITDYLVTRSDIDTGRIAIVGHSRLGKAVLLCGALDNRYSLVIAAGSGAGGAAIFRGKTGEKIENLSKHWFCGNMQKYAYFPEQLPFDQHCLIALAAPQRVYVSSASRDDWADPLSEFLGCAAASPAYEFMGVKGLVYKGFPKCGELLQDGYIAYHMREGTHALTREDWKNYMKYRERWKV